MSDPLHAERVDAHLRALIETAHDGIVIADAVGHITLFNRAAELMFGWSADEIVGQPLAMLVPSQYHDLHLSGLERLGLTGTSDLINRTLQLPGRRRDGSKFPMEMWLSSWHAGNEVFFTAIMTDATEN